MKCDLGGLVVLIWESDKNWLIDSIALESSIICICELWITRMKEFRGLQVCLELCSVRIRCWLKIPYYVSFLLSTAMRLSPSTDAQRTARHALSMIARARAPAFIASLSMEVSWGDREGYDSTGWLRSEFILSGGSIQLCSSASDDSIGSQWTTTQVETWGHIYFILFCFGIVRLIRSHLV